MSRKIVFEPIAFEDEKQKKATQFTTTVALIKDGKQVYPDETTEFEYQEYSGFAPKKFNPDETRDWIRIKASPKLEEVVNEYDDAADKQKDIIFGKYAKLYNQVRSVKQPKEEDELELETNADKPKKQKFNTVKLKLKTAWNYYYEGEPLDKNNSNAVRKSVYDALSKNNDKKLIDDIIVTIKLAGENGKVSDKKVKMSDIESRKEIATKVYYRQVDNISSDTKKIADCEDDNDELEKYYGKPEEMTVKTPDDLDKYHKYNCYVRYLYAPQKIWAAKSKGDDGKRRFSLQFVCYQMDIIHIKQNMTSQSTVRSIYSGYGFGNKAQTVFNSVEKEASNIKQIAKKTDESESESESESEEEEEVKKPVNKATPGKKSLKVETESEEEEEEEEESASESDEPEPPKKGAKGKAVVEEVKTKGKATPTPAKRKN